MHSALLVEPDIRLSEIMSRWPATIDVFLEFEMLCVGCIVAQFHTIADTCQEHGVNEALFRASLAAAISGLLPQGLSTTFGDKDQPMRFKDGNLTTS